MFLWMGTSFANTNGSNVETHLHELTVPLRITHDQPSPVNDVHTTILFIRPLGHLKWSTVMRKNVSYLAINTNFWMPGLEDPSYRFTLLIGIALEPVFHNIHVSLMSRNVMGV
jgi:hypothetical protein